MDKDQQLEYELQQIWTMLSFYLLLADHILYTLMLQTHTSGE